MFIRIRLIPVTIVFVILMLVFRIGSMWNTANEARAIPNVPSVGGLSQSQGFAASSTELLTHSRNDGTNNVAVAGLITEAVAQNVDNGTAGTGTSGTGQADARGDDRINTDDASSLRQENARRVSPKLIDLADVPLRDDPNTRGLTPLSVVDNDISDQDIIDSNSLSVAEVRLLHTLANRRRILDSRERGLIERESIVVAAERRLLAQQTELEEIRAEIRKNLRLNDEKQEQQIIQMREVYSTMSPKQAALIFNELDMDILVNVISGMSARKIAPIIGLMQVDKARDVTLRLADRTTYGIAE